MCGLVVGLLAATGGGAVFAQGACTRTYRGDLVLEGAERLVITEGVLCVDGNIILRDNARLEISNATLRLTGFTDSLFGYRGSFDVHDAASLELRNVRVEAPGHHEVTVGVNAYGGSRVKLLSVTRPDDLLLWCSGYDSSTMAIEATHMRAFVLYGDGVAVSIRNSTVDWLLRNGSCGDL